MKIFKIIYERNQLGLFNYKSYTEHSWAWQQLLNQNQTVLQNSSALSHRKPSHTKAFL